MELFKPQQDARFFGEAPPRSVSFLTRLTILFGGFLQQFGWVFFTFGMIFFWLFGWNSEARYWLTFHGPTAETNGLILDLESTNASENEVRVYAITFTYTVEGRTYIREGYSSGRAFSGGDAVAVVYPLSRPGKGWLKEGRRSLFSAWAILVAIFPLTGLGMILASFRKNLKFLSLLRNGQFTRGILVERKLTGGSVTINNRTYPIYAYTFSFSWKGKAYEATCNTHQTARVEDEELEIILFRASEPGYNVVYDGHSQAPDTDAEGRVVPAGWQRGWVLLLPVAGTTGHLLWALFGIN